MIDPDTWKTAWLRLDGRERRCMLLVPKPRVVAALSWAPVVGSVMPLPTAQAQPGRVETVPALRRAQAVFGFAPAQLPGFGDGCVCVEEFSTHGPGRPGAAVAI